MGNDQFLDVNGVDDAFVHKNMLEHLIKDKIMSINSYKVSTVSKVNQAFRSLFRKSRTHPDNFSYAEEQKLKIAIVEIPKNFYIENYFISSNEQFSLNIDCLDLTQRGLDSISLYNIEITGDPLIDYDINVNKNESCTTGAPLNIEHSSDIQSIDSSQTSYPSRNLSIHQDLNSKLKQIRNGENCNFKIHDYYKKYSLEAIPKISTEGYCLNNAQKNKLDNQHFVKLCLSESDITKANSYFTNHQLIDDYRNVPIKKSSKRRKKRFDKREKLKTKKNDLEDVIGIEVIDSSELPERARWTIIATAFLLLVMCLFLVGITLRMAPLIDDIVRQENERLKIESMKVQIMHQKNLTELRNVSNNYSSVH